MNDDTHTSSNRRSYRRKKNTITLLSTKTYVQILDEMIELYAQYKNLELIQEYKNLKNKQLRKKIKLELKELSTKGYEGKNCLMRIKQQVIDDVPNHFILECRNLHLTLFELMTIEEKQAHETQIKCLITINEKNLDIAKQKAKDLHERMYIINYNAQAFYEFIIDCNKLVNAEKLIGGQENEERF